MLKASDIMQDPIVTVSKDMTVEELGRLFIEKDISGVPVVEADGSIYGIVTDNDLISQKKRLHIPTVLRIFDAFIPLEKSDTIEEEIRRMSATTVADICTTDIVTINGDTSLDEIATIMAEKRIHFLPVVNPDGRLMGIVDKHDVLKGISREGG